MKHYWNWQVIKWSTPVGSILRKVSMRVGLALLSAARKTLKFSGGRCTWCGRDCGFQSSISRKGMRCAPDCEGR